MGYSPYKNSDNTVPYYQEFIADTLNDVANLPTSAAPGSTCLVLEDSSIWILGTDETWHTIQR